MTHCLTKSYFVTYLIIPLLLLVVLLNSILLQFVLLRNKVDESADSKSLTYEFALLQFNFPFLQLLININR